MQSPLSAGTGSFAFGIEDLVFDARASHLAYVAADAGETGVPAQGLNRPPSKLIAPGIPTADFAPTPQINKPRKMRGFREERAGFEPATFGL